ncbi:MAG: hypothetical protein GXP10_07920, partial [Gammaproteobacteria bacterium]|nr:hypothetical protein [Gammaproteobacteria bacterium]
MSRCRIVQRQASSTINCAKLSWRDGAPYSEHFGDCYYSRDGGLQESRYVFLKHNELPERWQQCSAQERPFTIAECGFGSGLNLLVTLDAFLKNAPTDARLHFVSAEKYPLTRDDLIQTLAAWRSLEPGLDPLIDELIESYPQPLPGYHPRQLLHGRVSLT